MRHDVERSWRLCDLLAVPHENLFANGLDDLPLARSLPANRHARERQTDRRQGDDT